MMIRYNPHALLCRAALCAVGQVPEWPNGADCKSAGSAFGGSNPSLPTITPQRRENKKSATLAQLVERHIRNVEVAGSIPAGGSSFKAHTAHLKASLQ